MQEITLFGNLVSVTVGECLMDLYHQKWKSLVLNKHVARSGSDTENPNLNPPFFPNRLSVDEFP